MTRKKKSVSFVFKKTIHVEVDPRSSNPCCAGAGGGAPDRPPGLGVRRLCGSRGGGWGPGTPNVGPRGCSAHGQFCQSFLPSLGGAARALCGSAWVPRTHRCPLPQLQIGGFDSGGRETGRAPRAVMRRRGDAPRPRGSRPRQPDRPISAAAQRDSGSATGDQLPIMFKRGLVLCPEKGVLFSGQLASTAERPQFVRGRRASPGGGRCSGPRALGQWPFPPRGHRALPDGSRRPTGHKLKLLLGGSGRDSPNRASHFACLGACWVGTAARPDEGL